MLAYRLMMIWTMTTASLWTIDDALMFHGGNPFDWDTRSDYLDDPFGFGGDDGDGGEDW